MCKYVAFKSNQSEIIILTSFKLVFEVKKLWSSSGQGLKTACVPVKKFCENNDKILNLDTAWKSAFIL